ncbi:MAG: glycosyltransferase [Candidatus Sumerlaeia bacterium]
MKIFHINMHNAWGGQPNRVLTKSIELQKLGHEVWVAGPYRCTLVQRAEAAGLKTFDKLELRRGLRIPSFRRDVQNLTQLFRREKFDILHTHGSQDTWITAFAARKFTPRIPLVRTRHNIFPIKGHLLNRWLYHKCIDHVITVSPQVNVYLTSQGLKQEDEITAIYSAPDQERFDCSRQYEGVREEFGLAEDDIVVAMVARLAPEKGHVHLVDAAAKLKDQYPRAKFLCIGTGRSRPDIEARIVEHGLENRVILTGFRKDVPRLLSAADIFVLSPVAGESLGTSILEGFLMKLPAVATDVGGVCESVRDGKTGFLVPPADPDALAEALEKLIQDPELRKQFGNAGHDMVLEEFTVEQLAKNTEAVYKKVLADRSANRQ